MIDVTLPLAFLAGLISFISPCVLPLVPAYVGYMGGRALQTASAMTQGDNAPQGRQTRRRLTIVLHALSFIGGFTFVFAVIGILPFLFISQVENLNRTLIIDIIGRAGGIIIIFFGLHFMGMLPSFFAYLRRHPALLRTVLTSLVVLLIAGVLIYWSFLGSVTLVDAAAPRLGAIDAPTGTLVLAGTAAISDTTLLEWFIPLPMLLALGALVVFMVLGGAFTQPERFWNRALNTLELAFYSDTRHQMTASGRQGFSSSALMGIVFAAGWTPCIGPIYGAILTMASQGSSIGWVVVLLAVYSLGLGLPFLLTAVFLDSAVGVLSRFRRHMRKVEIFSGVFLVIIGVLVASGQLRLLTQNLNSMFGDASIQLEDCLLLGNCAEAAPQEQPAPADSGAALPGGGNDAAVPTVGLNTGNLAPDFAARSVTGATVRLSDLRGQVVLLNFWATWCGPCRQEMPQFEQLYADRQAEGFVILAVNLREDAGTISAFGDELGLSFPLLLDETQEINILFGVAGLPVSYLIDREGIIRTTHRGVLAAGMLETLVDEAFAS